jgi:hypothetical protein
MQERQPLLPQQILEDGHMLQLQAMLDAMTVTARMQKWGAIASGSVAIISFCCNTYPLAALATGAAVDLGRRAIRGVRNRNDFAAELDNLGQVL